MPKQLIAGEPIEVLVLALQQFKFRKKREGMVHFNVRLELSSRCRSAAP